MSKTKKSDVIKPLDNHASLVEEGAVDTTTDPAGATTAAADKTATVKPLDNHASDETA
ncbi:hypothetical protein [Streptomyces sp. V3I7]|uniref:hypothetical protein n=1 Tax=Streptomyces sp. V3I7 TaxID=3042278 RepID=UPI002785BBB3|nr:hypothetical protein [Streptomyces sp. V3I7]MDQ0991476.1 hypothetical protein [Streptomyces sp. V3I7]